MKFINVRNVGLAGGSILVLLLNYAMDPDGHWAKIAVYLSDLAMPITAVWFAYIVRKVLMPYVELSEIIIKAKESTVGAGLVFVGTCIIMFGMLGLFGNQARASVATTIPTQAVAHLPTLVEAQRKEWPDHPKLNCSRHLSSTKAV